MSVETRYVILHFNNETDQTEWLNYNADLGFCVASSCSTDLQTCLELADDETFRTNCRTIKSSDLILDFECV